MQTVLQLTANDTYPTSLAFLTTDQITGICTPTDVTGFTINLEIDYGPLPLEPLIKEAVELLVPIVGTRELRWVAGDLIEGEWQAKLVITNALSQVLSTEFILLNVDRDITPPAP